MERKTSLGHVFQHEKLKEAREARGLTMRELTDKIGLNNHQSLSNYENGKSLPPAEVLFSIINVLKVPHNYFFEKDRNQTGEEIVFYRSKANTTVKLKKIHEIKIIWAKRIFNYLESIIEFPESDLPVIKKKEQNFFQPTDFEEIEEIALNLRKHWNLNNGPITDLTHLFEKHGIVVSIIKSEEHSIDACSKWIGNKLFILVGYDRSTPSRIKFTLAHELGHYLLHNNVSKEDFNKKDVYKRIESEANHFASAFLLPAKSFSEELIAHTMDFYLLLKKRWQVSIQAMIYRSRELNLINEHQATYLWKQIAKNGWRTKEPYDELLLNESPTLLKDAIELITKHRVKTKKELCEEIKLSQSDIEVLANLPYEYFNEIKGNSNIISFKR